MTTTYTTQYDAEAGEWLVIDQNGGVMDTQPNEDCARMSANELAIDDERAELIERLTTDLDELDLGTLTRMWRARQGQ